MFLLVTPYALCVPIGVPIGVPVGVPVGDTLCPVRSY